MPHPFGAGRVMNGRNEAPLAAAARWSAGGYAFVLAVVTDTGGSTPRLAGTFMFISAESTSGTVGGGAFEHRVIETARSLLRPGAPATAVVDVHLVRDLGMCCGGRMTAFLTRTEARPTLWIFGAGHIGTALAAQARLADIGVRVVDDRAEWARPERFDADVQVVDADPEDLLDRDGEGPSRGDWAVVTTHSHPLDEALVRRLATRDLGYLGLIGSRAKWARFRARLLDRGVPAEALERVRCPVGLDLGASTPAEIAVSIVAELITVRRRGAS